MRIAMVTGMTSGGVGNHVRSLADGLVREGHRVVVAAPPAVLRQFAFEDVGATVRAVQIADRPVPHRDTAAIAELRGLFKGADVVHAHGLRAGALADLGATGLGTPVVVTLHNAAPSGTWTARLFGALERVVASRSAAVLGVSQDLVDRMDDLGARRTGLAVIPAATAPAQVRWSALVRQDLGVVPGRSLVVVVGRLAPQKGLDLLLDAVGRCRDLPLHVVVAGEGPERDHLQSRIIAERLPVRLLGHRSDVPDLLSAADLVVSSAVWEGQPIGLQQALHAGAAIVATDVGGTGAVLGEAGVLVPAGDAAALADGIRSVLSDPARSAVLRSAARARAALLPTAADAVEAALSIYRDVASVS